MLSQTIGRHSISLAEPEARKYACVMDMGNLLTLSLSVGNVDVRRTNTKYKLSSTDYANLQTCFFTNFQASKALCSFSTNKNLNWKDCYISYVLMHVKEVSKEMYKVVQI